mmetsp:Transcript_16337/g.26620  ORF Transcript_16337/g.26620 Transcript_16337/m.26620 type:complete len:532 (+) Transcript_16337:1-1596(+)
MKAEEMFKKRSHIDPMAALAYGTIDFVKAFLSFTKEDIDRAVQRLQHAEKLANTICPADGYMSSMAKFMRIKGKKKLTNAQLRCNVVKALANAELALSMFVQESMMHFVKAGLALRRSYTKLMECEAELATGTDVYDENCLAAIYQTVGIVNIALSSLPPKVLKVVSFLGYPCDREKGFHLLHKAANTRSTTAPFSQISIMVHCGIMPGVAQLLGPEELPKALPVLADARQKYPNSSMHYHVAGRIARVQRDLVTARSMFEKSLETQKELEQLKHIVYYDLAWCHCMELQWEEAARYFEILAVENRWSKCFYTYCQAALLDAAGKKDAAIELYRAAPGLSTQKFGGKRIPPEQFVLRKVEMYEEEDYDTVLPALELVVLHNMCQQMSPPFLQQAAEMSDAKMAELEGDEDADIDKLALTWFISGCMYKELGKEDKALALFERIYDNCEDIVEDTYIVPWAHYEHGVLLALKGREEGSVELLQQAHKKLTKVRDDFKDFNYEVRLGFKLQLSIPVVKGWLAQYKEQGKGSPK